MPELPEVETTRRGVEPWVAGQSLNSIRIHNPALRWPVDCPRSLIGQRVTSVGRRGKYLLLNFASGSLIIHLGMSGSLRVLTPNEPLLTHDHVELGFADKVLRLNDPRRFGSVLFAAGDDPYRHPLLARLGVEPLGNEFSGELLFDHSRKRRVAVKNLIMNANVVVGVGNIYAAESLFMAGIRPAMAAGKVSRTAYGDLAAAIREVLGKAVRVGGTTLRDFVGSDGQPGYFKQSLYVYGRDGQPCRVCHTPLKLQNLGQRATVYCPLCQTFTRQRNLAARSQAG